MPRQRVIPRQRVGLLRAGLTGQPMPDFDGLCALARPSMVECIATVANNRTEAQRSSKQKEKKKKKDRLIVSDQTDCAVIEKEKEREREREREGGDLRNDGAKDSSSVLIKDSSVPQQVHVVQEFRFGLDWRAHIMYGKFAVKLDAIAKRHLR